MDNRTLTSSTLVPLAALWLALAWMIGMATATTTSNVQSAGAPGDPVAFTRLQLTPASSPPTIESTQEGEIWYDSGAHATKVWDGSTWASIGSGAPSASAIAGAVATYGTTTPPTGWLACDGSSVAVADYSALHGVIGYTWGGSGDNFTLPDLRGRTVIGRGQGAGLTDRALAATGGEETHSITEAELAAHWHYTCVGGATVGTNAAAILAAAVATLGQSSTTGSGTAHNTMAPFAAARWMIKY